MKYYRFTILYSGTGRRLCNKIFSLLWRFLNSNCKTICNYSLKCKKARFKFPFKPVTIRHSVNSELAATKFNSHSWTYFLGLRWISAQGCCKLQLNCLRAAISAGLHSISMFGGQFRTAPRTLSPLMIIAVCKNIAGGGREGINSKLALSYCWWVCGL